MADFLQASRVVDGAYGKSAAEVIATLKRLDAALPGDDGLAWFNKLYLKVSERVGLALADGTFEDPQFIEHLDIVFAARYFSSLGAFLRGSDVPVRSWAVLFEVHGQPKIAPVQFALAGANAHINRDLMLAILDVCSSREIEPTALTPAKRDYERVNRLIGEVEQEVRNWFLTGPLRDIERPVAQIDRLVENFSLISARESAWSHACALWHLRGVPLLVDGYTDTIDRLVAFAGRSLLTRLVD